MTTEPEWTDESRGRALRLDDYSDSICPCGCGQPLEIARDKKVTWVVEEPVCYSRRALDRVMRQKRDAAAEADNEGALDGVRFHVRPQEPEEARK